MHFSFGFVGAVHPLSTIKIWPCYPSPGKVTDRKEDGGGGGGGSFDLFTL